MPTGPRPFPPTRSFRVVYAGSYFGCQWMNVMWGFATGSGTITQADLQTLSSDLATVYGDNFMPLLASTCLLNFTEVTLYSSGDDARDAFTSTAVAGGITANDELPAQVSACISWNIAPHYRGGHPRTYLCGHKSGQRASSVSWTGSYITALINAAVAFHEDFEAIGPIGDGIETIEHGAVSFVLDKEWRDPPVFRRILTGRVDSRIDTQRRRLGPDRIA